MKENQPKSSNLRRVALAVTLVAGSGLGVVACGGGKDKQTPTSTSTPISRELTLNVDRVVINVEGVATATATARPTAIATATPKPTETPRPIATVEPTKTVTPTAKPEVTAIVEPTKTVTPRLEAIPNWITHPLISEIYVPNDGNTAINRVVAPNQILAVSGGPMIVPIIDQSGVSSRLIFKGGPDTVTLVLFVGDNKQYNTAIVEGVVPLHNWAGTFSKPDQNPDNWKDLVKAKVRETMETSSSVPGGAASVNVAVIDAGTHRVIDQQRFIK